MILAGMMIACSGSGSARQESATAAAAATPVEEQQPAPAGAFSADSAYDYIRHQLAFGPRVPGTPGHKACGNWLESRLRAFGADTVIVQQAEVEAFNGDRLPLRNIIARYNPQAAKRVLLIAHWDTRPWADADPDEGHHSQPIPGANDGASGVAVLLEIARNFAMRQPAQGVDLFMTDAEDYGSSGSGQDESWCLGTQHFMDNLPYTPGNMPEFAIVLDMVGGRSATFKREYFSDQYARPYVDKVWKTAARLGFGDRFSNVSGPGIIDDHVFVIRGGIPAIDIVECQNTTTGSFPPQWHTMADDIDAIDRTTLNAVGTTVLDVLYNL